MMNLKEELAILKRVVDNESNWKSPTSVLHTVLTVSERLQLLINLEARDHINDVQCEHNSKWIPAETPPESIGPHFPVQVLAVIDDPKYRVNDDAFVDIAAYWPSLNKWTVTHQCAADEDAADYTVNVTHWQPLPELPKK
jgi:hypothetical protein